MQNIDSHSNIRRFEHAQLFDDIVVLDEQLAVALVWAAFSEGPAGRQSVFVEITQQRLHLFVGEGHVVFYGVQTSENEVVQAHLRARSAGAGDDESAYTHDACELALELLDDRSETATGKVKETPAFAHSLAVPSRVGVVARVRHVALVVPEPVLEENAEFERMCDEQHEP